MRLKAFLLNITIALQALQPSRDFGPIETNFATGGSGQSFREDLRQRLSLQIPAYRPIPEECVWVMRWAGRWYYV